MSLVTDHLLLLVLLLLLLCFPLCLAGWSWGMRNYKAWQQRTVTCSVLEPAWFYFSVRLYSIQLAHSLQPLKSVSSSVSYRLISIFVVRRVKKFDFYALEAGTTEIDPSRMRWNSTFRKKRAVSSSRPHGHLLFNTKTGYSSQNELFWR